MDELKCSLNYEAEYERICDKYNELREKHYQLECDFKALEAAFARANAQIEIVHLIFGRR